MKNIAKLLLVILLILAFSSCSEKSEGAMDPNARFPSSPILGETDVDADGNGWADQNLARAALIYNGELYYSQGSGYYRNPPLGEGWSLVGTIQFQIPMTEIPQRELESNRISEGAPIYTDGRTLAVLVNERYVMYWKG